MSFSFALDQLRFAIAARRTAILDHAGTAPEVTATAVTADATKTAKESGKDSAKDSAKDPAKAAAA